METFIGDVQLFPYGFTPRGWSKCDGTIMTIDNNQALFSLLGSEYGGDGRTTFALPNLQGAEPFPKIDYYIALQGEYPQRN